MHCSLLLTFLLTCKEHLLMILAMTKSPEMSKLLEGKSHVQGVIWPLLETAQRAATHFASVTLEKGRLTLPLTPG